MTPNLCDIRGVTESLLLTTHCHWYLFQKVPIIFIIYCTSLYFLLNGSNFVQVYEHMMFIFVPPAFEQQLGMGVCEMSINLLST